MVKVKKSLKFVRQIKNKEQKFNIYKVMKNIVNIQINPQPQVVIDQDTDSKWDNLVFM